MGLYIGNNELELTIGTTNSMREPYQIHTKYERAGVSVLSIWRGHPPFDLQVEWSEKG